MDNHMKKCECELPVCMCTPRPDRMVDKVLLRFPPGVSAKAREEIVKAVQKALDEASENL